MFKKESSADNGNRNMIPVANEPSINPIKAERGFKGLVGLRYEPTVFKKTSVVESSQLKTW